MSLQGLLWSTEPLAVPNLQKYAFTHSGAHLCIHKSLVSQSLVINFIAYQLKPCTDNIISFQCPEDSASHSLTPFFWIFFPSSNVSAKHNVSEAGSAPLLRWQVSVNVSTLLEPSKANCPSFWAQWLRGAFYLSLAMWRHRVSSCYSLRFIRGYFFLLRCQRC